MRRVSIPVAMAAISLGLVVAPGMGGDTHRAADRNEERLNEMRPAFSMRMTNPSWFAPLHARRYSQAKLCKMRASVLSVAKLKLRCHPKTWHQVIIPTQGF